MKVVRLVADERLDLALMFPAEPFHEGLKVYSGEMAIGAAVAAWGFPFGYPGVDPLLTAGYLAGSAPVESGGPIRLWVNGAFNVGTSGGPFFWSKRARWSVVSAKVAPIPQVIEDALRALENQKSGFVYTARGPDGKEITLSEGQVVGAVLQYLRSQTQLVIGAAVGAGDLISFLRSNGVDP